MAKDDFRLLEEMLVGKAPGGGRSGAITKEDMEAYKYTFQHFGKYTLENSLQGSGHSASEQGRKFSDLV